MGMEHYNDTPLVNGTAYPVLEVKPKSYRLRVLNAANDRFFNLQMYVADGSVVTDDGRRNTEVKMIPAEVPKNTVITRVFRFYNLKNGVHFYTASEAEKDSTLANLGATYKYEGVAYSLNSAPGGGNDTPLYRFYNMKTGVHFYTASRGREEQRHRQPERDLPARGRRLQRRDERVEARVVAHLPILQHEERQPLLHELRSREDEHHQQPQRRPITTRESRSTW